MKQFTLYLTIVAALVLLVGCPVFAEDTDESQKQPTAERQRGQRGQREQGEKRWKEFVEAFEKAIQPTTEQKPGIKNAFKEHQAQMETLRQRDKSARLTGQKLQQAKQKGDEEAVKALSKEMDAHKQARQQVFDNLKKSLAGVLTEEQMAKANPLIDELANPKPRQRLLERVDLTDDQQAKAKAIMDDARQQASKTEDKDLKEEILADARERVAQTVLTEEQRQTLQQAQAKSQGPGGGWGAGDEGEGPGPGGEGGGQRRRGGMGTMTEAQQAQVREIMDAARQQAEGVESREERREIFRAAMEKVRDEVLTDEQRQQMEEQREQWRQRREENNPMNRIGASEEQKTQAKAIMDAARQQAEGVESREERREIFRAAMQKVHEEVLTEEQRQQMDEMRKQWEERRRQWRERRESGEDGEGQGQRRGRRGQGRDGENNENEE